MKTLIQYVAVTLFGLGMFLCLPVPQSDTTGVSAFYSNQVYLGFGFVAVSKIIHILLEHGTRLKLLPSLIVLMELAIIYVFVFLFYSIIPLS